MTKIPSVVEVVEEFGNQFDELNMKPPKNSMPGLERELLKDFMRKALQAQRDAGARDNNSIAIKAIEGYNQEKIELTRMMREVGNQEFYLQTEVKNRMEVIDSKILALTPPTK